MPELKMQKRTEDTTSSDEINDNLRLRQLIDDDNNIPNVGAAAKNDDCASVATVDVHDEPKVREFVMDVGTSEQSGLSGGVLEQTEMEFSPPTTTCPVSMTENDEVLQASLDPTSARTVRVKPAKSAIPTISQRRLFGDWASQEEDEIFNQQIKAASPSWEGALQISPRFSPRAHSFQEKGQTSDKETDQAEGQDEKQAEEHDDQHVGDQNDELADERAADTCQSTFSDSSSEESLSDVVEQTAKPISTLGETTSQTPIKCDQDKVDAIDNMTSESPRNKFERFPKFNPLLKIYHQDPEQHTLEIVPELRHAERRRQWRREAMQTQEAIGLRRPKRPLVPRSSFLRHEIDFQNLPVVVEEPSEQASPSGHLDYTDSEYEKLYTHETVFGEAGEVYDDCGLENFSADIHTQAEKWQKMTEGSQIPSLIRPSSWSEQELEGYEGQFTQNALEGDIPSHLNLSPDHQIPLPQNVETYRKGHRRTQSAPIHSFDYTDTLFPKPYLRGQKCLIRNAAGNRREYWLHRSGMSLTEFEVSIESITPFFEEDADLYKRKALQTDEVVRDLKKALEDIETLTKTNEELKTNSYEASREEAKFKELQMRLVDQVRENKTLKDEKSKVEMNHQQLIACFEDADEEKTTLQQELRQIKANFSEAGPTVQQSSLLTGKENEVVELSRAKALLEARLRTNVEELKRTKRDTKEAVERAARLDEQIHLESQRQHAQLEKQIQQAQQHTQVLLEAKGNACEMLLEDQRARHQAEIARVIADHETDVMSLQAANEAMQVELQSLKSKRQGYIEKAVAQRSNRDTEAQLKEDNGANTRDSGSSIHIQGGTLIPADRMRRLKMLYAPKMMHERATRISNVLTSIELEQKVMRRRLELDDRKHKYVQEKINRAKSLGINTGIPAYKR